MARLRWIFMMLVAFILVFHSKQVVGTTNEPWNQLGANVDTSDSPRGQAQGGTLQPQRNPTTTPPRSTTTANYNSTEVSSNSTEVSSNSTEVSSNSTEFDFNTTTIIPNTNLDQDGLTDSSKGPTSSKPLTKAVTVDSSLVSPDLGTTEELPSSAETLTNRSPSATQSYSPYNTSTQMASSDTTETASPTSQSNTVLTSKLSVTEFSNATSPTPPITREPTQTEMTTEPEITTQYSTTSAMPSSTTPRIHTTAFTDMSTTDYSISTPSPQSTTISVTPQVPRTSTEFDETSISATFAPRITSITLPRSSSNTRRTVHTSTHSSMPNQTATIIVVTKSHQHGGGKVTKQSDEHQGPSAEPATEEYQHPIDGDHNDPDLPSDPVHPKDPSNNQNIPNRYPEGHRENEQMTIEPDIYPPVYIQLVLVMSSSTFCHERDEIESELLKVAKDIVSSSPDIQAGFIGIDRICDFGNVSSTEVPGRESSITMEFYLTVAEMYDANTTRKVGDALKEDPSLLNRYITVKVSAVYILSNTDMVMPTHDTVKQVNTLSIEVSVPIGFILLLVLGVAAFVIYKAYKLRVARQTYKDRYYFDGKQLHDSMSDTQKLSPKESKAAARLNLLVPAVNQALELDEPDEIALQVFPSHILSINALAKFYTYIEAIVQEYQTLPDFQAILRNKPSPSPHSPRRLAATLPGHQLFDKYHHHHHRHHDFQSPTKTQVKLEKIILGDSPTPINANFVVGYNESSYAYIACQAPQGAGDEFWQMVWEQQTKTIILLCAPEEMGTRCSWYWPKDIGIQSAQLYGDILVMLQGQVRTENYIMSTLLIKDIQKNLCRPVIHCWFCQWPEMEIPINPRALIVFLMQVRQTYQENPGPIVVACSDGCGRTGTLISIDICMQSLEDVRSVDIPSTVSNVRQDRGSAVHNREQYSFIYKVLYEYSTMLIASGCPESNFMSPQTTQSMPLRVMYQ